MKRGMRSALALWILVLMAAGCAGQNAGGGASGGAETTAAEAADGSIDVSSFATIGDARSVTDEKQSGYTETHYYYAFEVDGTDYRVVADLTAEESEALWAVDFDDEKRDEKIDAIVNPLPIAQLDDLTAGMPTDEELESLVGRNCGELLDEGWIFSGCMYEEKELWMIHGIYEYTIIFDGEIENKEDFDENAELSHLTVSSITCTGVGDAGYLEEEGQAE